VSPGIPRRCARLAGTAREPFAVVLPTAITPDLPTFAPAHRDAVADLLVSRAVRQISANARNRLKAHSQRRIPRGGGLPSIAAE
jgi:hypothetical protein